jgi:hypothetical protein
VSGVAKEQSSRLFNSIHGFIEIDADLRFGEIGQQISSNTEYYFPIIYDSSGKEIIKIVMKIPNYQCLISKKS